MDELANALVAGPREPVAIGELADAPVRIRDPDARIVELDDRLEELRVETRSEPHEESVPRRGARVRHGSAPEEPK